jgi:branched-chain amino acid transport system ATP-binding protein
MISIRDLTVQFGGVRPLENLEAELSAPIVGLVGPNGAGKTTLLNVLSGFVTPISGRVEVDGIDLLALSPTARVRQGLRRTFQTEQVVDDLSVFDNVLALLDHVPRQALSAEADIARAFSYLGLDRVADRLGIALSLFERRLVEIAKALVGGPRLLLMDEPAAGLTEAETESLRRMILGIPESFAAQILLIDHDVDLIAATCSETLVLDFGQRLALGPTRVVLDDPAVRAAYLGSV